MLIPESDPASQFIIPIVGACTRTDNRIPRQSMRLSRTDDLRLPENISGKAGSGEPDVRELAGVLVHRERIGNRPGSVQNRAHQFMVVLRLPDELPAPAVLMHPREGAGTAQRECRRPTPALPRGRRVYPCLIILTILTADLPHLVHSHPRTRKRNATIRF